MGWCEVSANSIGVFSNPCSFKLFKRIYFILLSSQTFINWSVQNTFKFPLSYSNWPLLSYPVETNFQWQFFESSVEVDDFQIRAARMYLICQLW